MRVLIIEPDEKRAMDIAAGFSSTGHYIAQTGDDALDVLDAGRFDVVLVNLVLPDMDGADFAAEMMRELGDGTPAVGYMTEADHAQDQSLPLRKQAKGRFLRSSGDAYLPMPFTGDVLSERIATVISENDPV